MRGENGTLKNEYSLSRCRCFHPLERLKRLEVDRLLSFPIIFSPATPISKIVGALKQVNGYEVFLEGTDKIGMVTLRDILRASNVTRAKAETLAFYVPKLQPRSSVYEAVRLMMEYHIRALPVVEGKKILGNITYLSIINVMNELGLLDYTAANIMTRNPATLNEDAPASKARQLMIRRRIDHLPILSKKGLVGVLTSSHLVFNMFQATETLERSTIISEQQRKLEFPVKPIMNLHPVTCQPNDKISHVLDEMTRLGTTYSIVQLWDEVQGIITYRDYTKLLAEPFEQSSTPIYIVGLPDDPFDAEMAKSKFGKTVDFLKKSLPYIEEAKSTIRTFPTTGKSRRRYDVKVSIVTPKRVFTYSETGWELSSIYDAISNKLKNMLQKRRRPRTRRQ
jgi:CBS domain-containing protein